MDCIFPELNSSINGMEICIHYILHNDLHDFKFDKYGTIK